MYNNVSEFLCNLNLGTFEKEVSDLDITIKAENDSEAKIEMLPEHCIIDNDNHLTIADVDKRFYIDMAKKRINDFMGIKPEKKGRKKMANATKNVYQKLLEARVLFMEEE